MVIGFRGLCNKNRASKLPYLYIRVNCAHFVPNWLKYDQYTNLANVATCKLERETTSAIVLLGKHVCFTSKRYHCRLLLKLSSLKILFIAVYVISQERLSPIVFRILFISNLLSNLCSEFIIATTYVKYL